MHISSPTSSIQCSRLCGRGGRTVACRCDLHPAGATLQAHATTTRLWLKKGRGETRVVKIIASPSLPEREATFSIANEGVCDVKE